MMNDPIFIDNVPYLPQLVTGNSNKCTECVFNNNGAFNCPEVGDTDLCVILAGSGQVNFKKGGV